MDAINETGVETNVIMFSAQVGKSEINLNMLGYIIDYDPGPVLLLQPTETNAEDFSKDRQLAIRIGQSSYTLSISG